VNNSGEKHKQIQELELKRKVAVFLFFLAISTVFWFLNALNSEYETSISFRTEFSDLPSGKTLPTLSDENLTLNIKAYGFDILAMKLSEISPFQINIAKYGIFPKAPSDSSSMYILTDNLINSVQDQIGTKIRIRKISPDTVFFNFSKTITKKLPIFNAAELIPAPLYLLSGQIKCEPESIRVTGTKEVFENIRQISVKGKVFSNLRDNFEQEVELLPIDGLTYSEQKVRITAEFEQYTEEEFSVPITILNLPDNVNIRTFPEKIKVSFKIPLSRFNDIKASMFVFTADYRKIKKDLPQQIIPEFVEQPPGLTDLKITPSKLDYLIEM
jgi:hypothetical protein